MLRHKIEFLTLLFFYTYLHGATPSFVSTSESKLEGKPATVYATILPKVSSMKITSVQIDGGAESSIVSNMNYGSEFSWGLTNERLHFLLFGEVSRVSLVAPSSATVKKELIDGTLSVAKGGFGIGMHPTRSRDFFLLVFSSFEQAIFTHGSSTDTNKIIASRLTIPHLGVKLGFTTMKWKFLSLGGELNGAYAFSTSNADDSVNWGYSGFGRMVISAELSEKLNLEMDPQFGYTKYFGLLANQSRLEAGVSLGLRVFLD